jgi:3-hydroxybutyryl-CoA dehydratase
LLKTKPYQEKSMTALLLNTGLFFEDFQAGQKVKSAGRTVTEHDIATFAGLSGDFNQIHTDAEFARSTPYGQRIAHGLLGLSIASGLAVQTGILGANVIAFREVGEWKFVKPVFIGDTIHVDMEVMETKALPRLGGGLVSLNIAVNNQSNETAMKGLWTVLVKTRGK